MIALLMGCVMAYIVNIPMVFYEKYFIRICKWSAIRRMRRPFCMFLSFLTILLSFVVLWQLIVPQIAACAVIIFERFPQTLDLAYNWLEKQYQIGNLLADYVDSWTAESFRWENLLKSIPESVHSLKNALQKLGYYVVTFVVSMVFAIYLLAGKEHLAISFRRLGERFLPEKPRRWIHHVFSVLNRAFHSFVVGQCVEAVILGALCTMGMWIFRFPYAIMVGCLVGVTALIPVVGAYIGAGVGAFMILTISPLKALLFLIFLAVLQQVEGNLIYPRVVGTSIGLPGIWVLVAVVAGGAVWGVAGILISVPLVACVYQLLKEAVEKGLEKGEKESYYKGSNSESIKRK